MENKDCSCAYMFDHGICAHLIRIALLEEIALPGMEARQQLITKQREKIKKNNEKIVESDQEFEENLNAIEQQASTQVTSQVTNQATIEFQESTNELQEIVPSNENTKGFGKDS